MTEKKIKPVGPKPWARRVAWRQYVKSCDREHWSIEDNTTHEGARDTRRQKPMRPRMMAFRLAQIAEFEASQRRRQRMLDYHARRRAGLA